MTEDDASSGQLTFAHRLFYRALLQKRPIILRSGDVSRRHMVFPDDTSFTLRNENDAIK